MAKDNVKFNLDGMEELVKALKKDRFVRVGIIGSKAKAKHNQDDLTNALLGTFHEFGGTSKNGKEQPPRRSFLEDSLKYKLNFKKPEMTTVKKSLFKYGFEEKDFKKFFMQLGSKCLEIIEQGFASNGFGMWKPLASLKTFEKRYDKSIKGYNRVAKAMERGKMPYDKDLLSAYIKEAQNPLILTDTGKLRKSISFKVMERK